jgi:nucleotide-binding universal stress UspA family protein
MMGGDGRTHAVGASMKAILVPVEDHAGMNAVFETTLLFAQKFGSYMEGAALGPDLAEMVAADFSLGGVVFDDRTRRELLDQAFAKFESFMLAHAVKRYDEASSAPSFGWLGDTLISDNGIGEYGRVFDLVAVGRPGSGLHQARKATLEAALFESGRPLLIAPRQALSRLGECVVIAWNGSSETARTVAFAMPLLLAAQDVPIVMIPGARLPGPSDEQLAKSLRRHGIKARTVPVSDPSKSQGSAVLETAAALGADLLIKGGYTQSRLRQLIFGSATGQILAEADLPIFMAH